ncbi:filamentous hemagglutinin outer membrane protein [Herbaspirillum rubrisubalbicans M1]|uniref:two-partner secretion domain-containing protein n=1 Tax=Herbaspirillum rubrisubalbicans TaxID=80842 RepID=UPI00073A44D2|nr:hemagglutinin repeat-containing protein [Herbaspirillum rubrisubalbicans]ALU88768.1 filamentous hemagglutinin outer membrane protein [Herbaspirillum rubrisubalbicans M1]
MNRQRYKLVFNRHRGQLMAVAEIASSIQHQGRTAGPSGTLPDLLPSALRFSLLSVALALAMNTVAHAQILGDRTAPRTQQPTVLVTPNGVPVVNIQTPSTAGVSLNRYRQFDVGTNGVILNNARSTTSTQLGGYVAGNPWLATGAARVIVNQVNSPNPSYLRGYLEVAGNRAQVVVANPAGITCAGCGFINANRATLTTGVPQINNGNLDSYRVASGAVNIEGNGLDASRTDYAEIIARAVQVNAGVWAPELKVSAGLNTVSADHASVQPGVAPSDAAPAVAIDVAQLGGMYAGHIYLTSTEHGVGVRNAGTIGAAVGQAVVTADGRLENSGSLSANGLLAVQTTGGVRNSGELGSKSAASITTTALDNAGSMASSGALTVQASDSVLNTGSIGGEGPVQVSATSIDNRNSLGSSASLTMQTSAGIRNSGTLQATTDATLNAGTLDNSGTLSARQGSVRINSSGSTTNSGRIEAVQTVAVQADGLTNSGNINAVDALRVQAAQAISNSGTLGANGGVELKSATLDNRGTLASSQDALTITTSGQLANQGQVSAAQSLTLTGAGIDNSAGTLNATDIHLDSQSQTFSNRGGQVSAQRDLQIASGSLDNSNGTLAAQGQLTVGAATLNNDGGLLQAGTTLKIDASGKTVRNSHSGSTRGIQAQGTVDIAAATLVNAGLVSSNSDINLNTATLDNRAGSIGATGKLTVQGNSVTNSGGQLQAKQGVDIQAGSGLVDNSGGLLRSDGTVNVQAGSVRNDNTQGQDQGVEGATVNVAATDISNRQGAVRGDAITLTASGRIDNGNGLISATNSAVLTDANPSTRTLAIDNSNGTIIAGRQTTLLAYSFTGSGRVLSQKDLRMDLVASILHTGQIGATAELDLRTAGTFTNAGSVGAGGTLTLTAATIDNQASGSLVGNTLRLKATDVHTFINRGLIDGVNTIIESSTVNNLGTGRIYGDNIAIGADVLNNQAETVDGVTSAPVIAARNRLDIGAGVINNSEHGLIYSVGDMVIGGALDANKKVVGSAREVNNSSATINADGNLSIAAGSINNNNAHLETTDQTGPGKRIISYRVNGSSQLIDGTNARLFNPGNGAVVAPENWRAMGDEDNFRLLLPSAQYPFERYGPPFTYVQGSSLSSAYIPAMVSSSTDDGGTTTLIPEQFVYAPDEKIWDVFGVARPTAVVPPEPIRPAFTADSFECVNGGGCVMSPAYEREAAAWKTAHDAWQAVRDEQLPHYQALNQAIADFSANLRGRQVSQWTIYDGTEQITRTVVTKSDPGMITSGGNMNLAVGALNNYASQVIAGGTLAGDSVNGTAINNTGPLGMQRVVSTGSAVFTYIKSHRFSADDRRYDGVPYQSQDIVTNFQLDVSPTSGAGPNRANSVRAVPASVSGAAGASAGAASIRIASLDLTLPNNALYRINAGPAQRYLVQTDPQFVGTRNWLSSDFMLNQLGLQSGVRQLGDGFYEQQLVQRQIQQITGQRYLAGYSSNEAQYQALMNAGLQVAQAQRYTVGVALTDAQVAALKTDIVWLVKQTVTLADGSTQEVLVPQVYVHASNVEVTGQGTLIAGNDVAFQAAQDIVNSGGTIAARKGVSLAGADLQNLGGRISGADVQVAAAQDINNIGGTIDARNSLVATAGRDINSASTTVATANAVTSGTNINQNASMSVSEANGSLTAVAGRDINLKASGTSADNITLVAQRDVNISTVHETSQEKLAWDNDNRAEVNHDNAIGSTVQGKDISVTAGRDINAQAAYVNAEGSLAATAANNINIGTDVSTASARDQHKKTDAGGVLSSRTVTTDDSSSERINQGTTLSGNTVVVRAGKDINVIGSNVVATQGVGMAAGNDVNIVAAVDSSTKNNFRKETTSGVMGAGFGVTIGTREQSHDGKSQGQTASASTIGSTDGNVSIVAGNRYTQVGSDVMAPKGDIDIAAKSVEIRAAEQASKATTEDKFKQTGLTVAVTSPVISAIQTVGQMADAASKTKDGRMQALAAANMGFAGKNAYDAVKAGQGFAVEGKDNPQVLTNARNEDGSLKTGPDGNPETRDATAADKVGGINLALSLGSSSSESRSQQSSNTVRGSTVSAGGSINISAQGGGTDSNIVIQGSDIKAGVNATLKAANEVRLLAAQNTSEQHSNNQSSSGSVGVSIGTDGLMFNASASGSRGRGDGSDVTQVNTHVDAGNKLTIASGTDTTLKGAVVSGKQVVMDVGTSGKGNLNIESLQDTSTYKSKQQSLGGSISVGMGKMSGSLSASRSTVDGNFASVNEQSGIRAGDGGFQINVKGNTDLKGGKIASTDKAAAEGKNSLTTETLTQSDIQNRSDYKAESQSASIGGGFSGGKSSMNGTGIGVGSSSGSESSTTKSGISQANIKITDDAAQQAKTGKTAEQTIASINTDVSSDRDTSGKLTKQWDAQALQADVQAQAQITEMFGKNAAKEIGSYATTKVNELNAKIDVAQSEGEKAALIAERDKWDEGGLYRTALHTAAGLLGGGVDGAIGAATSSVAMPQLAKLIDNTELPLPVRQVLAQAAAAALGGIAGGTSGLAAGIHVEANNRQLHETESAKLSALKKGKSPEEQRRLNAAACALVRCADGVPPSDPYYGLLKGLQDKGATYQNEIATLLKTGEFVYIPRFDAITDFITRNGEFTQRTGGLVDMAGGVGGVLAAGSLAVTGAAACGPSAGMSCLAVPVGLYGVKVSNDQLQQGHQVLFGPYLSTEGARVLASFDIETYPGERIPLEEIGLEAGKRALIQVLGKYLPKGLMAVEEGILKRSSTGTVKSVARTAEEIDAIEKLATRNDAQSSSSIVLRSLDQLVPEGKIPSVRNGAFNDWYNQLSPQEFNRVWAVPEYRDAIQARIRQPGGLHEWLPVSQTDKFKSWNLNMEDIKAMRTFTKEIEGTNPNWAHGGEGSTTAHNEMIDLVNSSSNFTEYKLKLQVWADKRLVGGRSALPEGLRN